MSQDPLVTIVIPNWNTGPLLRICLASVVRFTRVPHRVIVIDNASTDASRKTAEAAARDGLIELIARDDAKNEGAEEHGARRAGWLEAYVTAIGEEASHAGAAKFPGGRGKRLWGWLTRKVPGPEALYIRPCHALYRVEVLARHGLSFMPVRGEEGRWRTTGEMLHERLVALGETPAFMPHTQVERLVGHLRHSTFVLNAERFPTLKERARRRGEAKIESLLTGPEAAAILDGTPIS